MFPPLQPHLLPKASSIHSPDFLNFPPWTLTSTPVPPSSAACRSRHLLEHQESPVPGSYCPVIPPSLSRSVWSPEPQHHCTRRVPSVGYSE
ncbi:hypothetical protein NQZ68_002490 [Dissostichus eleginoides]|nr:hypothetical protein NQZ68_002490 [Dissostichus eleginoides]